MVLQRENPEESIKTVIDPSKASKFLLVARFAPTLGTQQSRDKKMSVSQGTRYPTSIEASCYGLHPIAPERLQADAAAIMEVLALLENHEIPQRQEANSQRFQVVSRLLSAVVSQSDPTWFTVSELFGHPAPELARRLMQHMSNFSRSIKQQDQKRYTELVEQFDNDRGFEVLDSYLDVALRGEAPVGEDKMAYIMKVPGKFSLQIGACDETLRDFLTAMIKDRGFSQQRPELLGAWLIHDPQEVQAAISTAFKMEAMSDGTFFINEHKAKPMLEALLKQTNNYVLSPWHVEDEPSAGFGM
ncbi:hypothetical protein [Rhizobium sp. MHM7A]|uniref:hypothetical protein n=1 Tax=Rhizobium sp. MHM7A TaxID=2583233 RepID=UPI001105C763|nr:hypothetical protein [Rhizobium sp. MHM7A]TLX16105.1 hypothetical protein FFR93_01930 [Rhizobium sp. MHM7A]